MANQETKARFSSERVRDRDAARADGRRTNRLACLCRLVGVDRFEFAGYSREPILKLLLLVEDFLALPMQSLTLLQDVLANLMSSISDLLSALHIQEFASQTRGRRTESHPR